MKQKIKIFALLLLIPVGITFATVTRLGTTELNSLESGSSLEVGLLYWDTDLQEYSVATAVNHLESLLPPTGSVMTTAELVTLKSSNQVQPKRLYWNSELKTYELGQSVAMTTVVDASATRKTTGELTTINTGNTATYNLLYWDTVLKKYYTGQSDNSLGDLPDGASSPYWALNEGMGTSFSASGGGQVGTLYGGTGWTSSGADSNALVFDGNTGSYASIEQNAVQMPTNEFSIESWYRWDVSPGTGNHFARLIDKNSNDGFHLSHSYNNDKITFWLKTDDMGRSVESDPALFTPTQNIWNQVVATYDGSNLKLYVNGVFQNQTSLSGAVTAAATNPIYLGGKAFNGNDAFFAGTIDEVSIHDSVLSAAEILSNYNSISSALVSCSDGIQNQDETGVDCGGVCSACAVVNAMEWPLDEGTGSTFTDTSSSAAGSLVGGSSWVTGVSNGGLGFDGVVGSYASIAHHPDQLPQDGFSLETWYQWDIDPSTGNSFARLVDKGSDNGYKLEHNYNNSELSFWLKTNTMGTSVSSGAFSPVQGTWYHVVTTYDGANLKMYINGVLKNTASLTGTVNTAATNPIYLGGKAYTDSQSHYFQGKIDEFAIWDQVLTPTEITDRYTALAP